MPLFAGLTKQQLVVAVGVAIPVLVCVLMCYTCAFGWNLVFNGHGLVVLLVCLVWLHFGLLSAIICLVLAVLLIWSRGGVV